jgi:cyclohexanone monooxygenase
MDKQQLAGKYAEERAKRVRSDGNAQYREIGIGSALESDPFVETAPRDPVRIDTEVVIAGAGWSGMLAAVRLKQQGIDDFRIVDKAADFGGTWYWNRYPGIACDTESYIYLPLLEETGYVPTMRYAPGEEIREYARSVARRFDLYDRAVFQAIIQGIRWDEEAMRWIVSTNRGDEIRGRFLVLGTGALLHRPKLPGIEGLDTFEGHSFHTSRWDFDYTGGDSRGNLDKLADKRVAIIGTGLSALQSFPHVANSAKETYLFQRTPTLVGERANGPTDPDWFETQEPGWHGRRMDNFEAQMIGVPIEEKLVEDEWTRVWSLPVLEIPTDGSAPDLAAYMAQVGENDIAQMERIRARVDQLVEDPAVAESLKPWYGTHCKRPGFHDEYLQTFNNPNVHLVDTGGRGPEAITPAGIVFDGKEYQVDLIVYATGFEALVSPGRSGGFDISGRDGLTLADAWEKRVRTVHGIQVHDFPNMFIIGGLRQAAVTINVPWALGAQAKHVAEYVKQLHDDGVVLIDVTEEAVQEWCDTVDETSIFNEEQSKLCTPGTFNNEGNLDLGPTRPIFADIYGPGPFDYVEVLARWREQKQYESRATLIRAEARES